MPESADPPGEAREITPPGRLVVQAVVHAGVQHQAAGDLEGQVPEGGDGPRSRRRGADGVDLRPQGPRPPELVSKGQGRGGLAYVAAPGLAHPGFQGVEVRVEVAEILAEEQDQALVRDAAAQALLQAGAGESVGIGESEIGAGLVLTGVLFLTGAMPRISGWMLETLPAFGTIG